jgi:Saxitoxin biosynthesis operon protein SxtJ
MNTGIHEDYNRSHLSKRFSDRSLAFTFSGFFAVVEILRLLRHRPFQWGWLIASAVFLLIGLIAPGILHPISGLWARLGLLLHRIVNPIVTGVIFFVVFMPAGILFRLLGKDLLRLKPEPGSPTYWILRNPPGPAPETMRNQF